MKFSIVTPTYNSQKFIRQTIDSVLSQSGDFDIEYNIIDGGSTDSTIEIIEEFSKKILSCTYPKNCRSIKLSWISEKDKGMYDAINKGFKRSTGDVYAWINSDDFYLPNAFMSIQRVLQTFPTIEWVKGISNFVDEQNKIVSFGECLIYHKDWIEKGIYGRNSYHITQDSVFWTKKLWEKSGPIDTNLRYAGDYYLWINMSRYTQLWSLNKTVSVFRKRPDQLSKDIEMYKKEQQYVIPQTFFSNILQRIFFSIESRFRFIKPILIYMYHIFINLKPMNYIEVNNDEFKMNKAWSYRATKD